ncbi:MAG: excinuclease ABC subunit UvrC [Bacteroidaceae bacterium]|nr:excinuclease ABC subunit UvrC [Bacteroidaceae bacterium]
MGTFESILKKNEYLRGIVTNLPEGPGCYQYLNKEGTIIYVGKAKNLKRRVSSYFNKEQTGKTRILVSQIADIRYVVVETDADALLLENNLIKKYKPRYNVLLKDDKTYPSICISNEEYPKVFKTRNIIPKAGQYFGPYSHVGMMHETLRFIRENYRIRTCNLRLTSRGVEEGKFKTCLEYHINRCSAPCVGKQTKEDYLAQIKEIREILRGNSRGLTDSLMKEMKHCAENLQFEEAELIKKRYIALQALRQKSQVVSDTIHNVDVFNIDADEGSAYISYLHVTNGVINQAFTFEYKKRINEDLSDLLSLGIGEMRSRYKSESKEIIVPLDLDIELDNVTFTIPKQGDKKKLLELAAMNVKQYKLDKLKQAEKLNPEQKQTRILKEIQQHLKLERIPLHIECFDNSNISGSDAVAACIVFRNGKPAKNEYRKYNIKTVVGPDDYASMKEVVRRRYTRLVEENQELPDLIITDGGKGQMEVVREVIEDELKLKIPIAGLAKDNKHRTNELLYGFPAMKIGLKQDSSLFRLLVKIQDEVHRFAITFHRDKRSKHQTASALDKIPGIGPKTKEALLKKFKSVKRIKEAGFQDISKVIGEKKAKLIVENLK